MNLNEIIDILNAEVLLNNNNEDVDIEIACGSDLMSDVLFFIKPHTLLLTGLTNPQVINTAEIADIKIICFVRGKKPLEDTISLANTKNIILLWTPYTMFESCGKLYSSGLKGH